MTVGTLKSAEMGKDSVQNDKTQADFIQEEANVNTRREEANVNTQREEANVNTQIEEANVNTQREEANVNTQREEANVNTQREEDSKIPTTETSLNDHKKDYEWMDILGNGQLRKKVWIKGESGTRPNRGDTCILKIIGNVNSYTVVESYDKIVIQLGDLDVVQGLDLAIALMDIKETAYIEIHPRFAYGEHGLKPHVLSDTVITYTVELLAVEQTDIETLNIKERKELGNKKRARGNWWFSRDEPTFAIQCYRRSLDYLSPKSLYSNLESDIDTIGDADLQDLLDDRVKVYNNLAASQMKIQAFDAALESVENVLSFQPRNVKALYRKGKILHSKGEHAQAYATLQQAAKLEPESKIIQAELAVLKEKNAKDALHEKNLYRKMLGTNKNTNTSKKIKSEKKWKTNKTLWGLVGGTSAAVLVGLLAYRFAS